MLYPLRDQNPAKRFIPVNRMAVCKYMKMITPGDSDNAEADRETVAASTT